MIICEIDNHSSWITEYTTTFFTPRIMIKFIFSSKILPNFQIFAHCLFANSVLYYECNPTVILYLLMIFVLRNCFFSSSKRLIWIIEYVDLINKKSFNVKFWIPLNWAKLNKMAERYVIIELSLFQPIIFRSPYII